MIPDIKYTNIDLTYLNGMADGDDVFIIEVVNICIDTIPQSISKLTYAVVTSNTAELYFYSHKLRGSMNVVQNPEFTKLLDKIDACCKANDFAPIIDVVAHLSIKANEILEELKDVLVQMGVRVVS